MRNLILALGIIAFAGMAAASDRHVGYYYPQVTSQETFERVIAETPPAVKEVRVDFVTMLTASQLAAPESPRFVFSTKGVESEHLILVALDDQVFKTLYRARAVLAQMTSNVRAGDFFKDQDLQFVATFFDMLQMLEFDSLVITDGATWSHQINFKRN